MNSTVVQSIKRYLSLRVPELNALAISWFGGEPLLAREIIGEILSHTRSAIKLHPSVRFFSDITTNGYLLSRSAFVELLRLGVVQYQIAFDGPRTWHDKYRRIANGRGTFDRVWTNLQRMQDVDEDFSVLVRLHVNKDNYHALPAFIEDYRRIFRDDHRFRLFLRPLSRLGGANDAILPAFDEEEGDEAARSLTALAKGCGVKYFSNQNPKPICYASRVNSLVIRADGQLGKCTVALDHGSNQIGRIRADGHLDIETAKLRPWLRGIESLRSADLQCPLRGIETTTQPSGGNRSVLT